MKIIDAWRHRKAGLVGFIVIAIIMFWPVVPLRSLDTWLQTLTELFPTNIFYPIMAVLIGSYAALYMYSKECKTCSISSTATSASFAGVVLGACPACIPALAVFLPLSATVALSYFSWIFMLIAIIVLFFVLYKMEAFR